jgi:spermidine synthase
MLTRELIGTAQVDGGEELRLYAHGGDFIIALDRNELMSTRMRHSEEALATMTLDRLDSAEPHLLVGGYGMGFTLRAALGLMGPHGRATVAELVPEIIAWARGPMAAVADGCLDDPRVTLEMGDVGAVIKASDAQFDGILLDVDNGPDGLVRDANNWLYTNQGLAAARRALRPDGILAVWSGAKDKPFTKRLRDARFAVEEVEVRARPNGKGPHHTIWFARRV